MTIWGYTAITVLLYHLVMSPLIIKWDISMSNGSIAIATLVGTPTVSGGLHGDVDPSKN